MKKSLFILALCQALGMTASSLMITSAALVGMTLAPSPALSTLPLGLMFMATMLVLFPASIAMQKRGRAWGFSTGAMCLIIGALIAASGIFTQRFILFSLGLGVIGAAIAFFQFFRFAAIEVAPEGWESRAVSWVLAGGLLAAFSGPNLAILTRDVWQGVEFGASYLALVPLGLLLLWLVRQVRYRAVAEEARDQRTRPLGEIVRQFPFIVAVLGAMSAYGIMNLLMTATPLAMNGHAFHFDEAAFVIQWHIVGMFLPSFFTGHVIHRIGVLPVMITGVVLYLLVVAVNFSGNGFWNYWASLFALGVGWNFLFVGGTTLLATQHSTAEKGRVQGLNDSLVYLLTTLTAFASGALYHQIGWMNLNWLTVPVTLVMGALLIGLALSRKRQLA